MKHWKKLLLLLLALILLSQIPFAYRRYRLGRLHAAIIAIQSQRQASGIDGLGEYRGVTHVHSFLGGHSTGTFQEIIAAAHSNQLDFVLMSEHPAQFFDTAEATLKGEHGGVFFINGNEISSATGDRLLLFPGDDQASRDNEWTTQEVLSRRTSGLSLVAYPERFKSWDAKGYQGIEVYNVFSNTNKINPLLMFFDSVWSYSSYPDLLFATFYERPSENLKKWDEMIASSNQRLIGVAGNDSHANVGISLNDSAGHKLLGVQLDPYERSFRLVRLHVLGARLDGVIRDDEFFLWSISEGHCFIGFDVFGDTTGFRFTAKDGNESVILGDEITLDDQVRLTVSLPVPGRILLLRNGTAFKDDNGVRGMDVVTSERGSYRVEVYLPQLPGSAGQHPWIISNPIYVK